MVKNSYISRILEQNISILLNSTQEHRNVILIEGARQVGKTALIKHLVADTPHCWIDLQNDRSLIENIDRSQSFDEFTDILAIHADFQPSQGRILVIDEAQESARLGAYVRYMKEQWPHQSTILLGSAMHRLFRTGTKYPVGRVHRIIVRPFAFLEFLRATGSEYVLEKIQQWTPESPLSDTAHTEALTQLDHYLRVGGLPAVVLAWHHGDDWQDHIAELSFGYLEDYKRVHGEAQANLFRLILTRVAETLGSPSKLSTFVASHQPGYRDVPTLLNLAQQWHLVDRIDVETVQHSRNHRIPPKRYLFDHGIRSHFAPLTQTLHSTLAATQQHTFMGGVVENYVLNELRAHGAGMIVSWRERTNGSEVDFVVRHGETMIPIEVKATHKSHQKYLSSLSKFMQLHPDTQQGILCSGAYGIRKPNASHHITQVPLYAIGNWIKKQL